MQENQKTGAGSAAALDFYLSQIREIAKKADDPRSVNVLQSAEEAIEEQKKDKEEKPAEKQRDDVADPSVSETAGSFSTQMLGKMIFYTYDAKYKDSLPYWDVFPVMFPISSDGRSMLGMNLHYLPPVERARLMAALMTLSNTTSLMPQTKLLMTYKLLNASSKFQYFKPCLKKYLFSHIQSRVLIIRPEKWTNVLFLPLARFMKQPEDVVWRDSINKVRGKLFKK